MTTEEAQRIVANVSCRCDGMGVIPGPKGIAIQCPNCEGRFVSTTEYKEARGILRANG